MILYYLILSGADPSWEPHRLPHSTVSTAASQGVPVHHICHQTGCTRSHKLGTALSTHHGPGSDRKRPTTHALSLHAHRAAHELGWEQCTQQPHGHAQHRLQPWERGNSAFLSFHRVVVGRMSRHVWMKNFSHNTWIFTLISDSFWCHNMFVYLFEFYIWHHSSSFCSQKPKVQWMTFSSFVRYALYDFLHFSPLVGVVYSGAHKGQSVN